MEIASYQNKQTKNCMISQIFFFLHQSQLIFVPFSAHFFKVPFYLCRPHEPRESVNHLGADRGERNRKMLLFHGKSLILCSSCPRECRNLVWKLAQGQAFGTMVVVPGHIPYRRAPNSSFPLICTLGGSWGWLRSLGPCQHSGRLGRVLSS